MAEEQQTETKAVTETEKVAVSTSEKASRKDQLATLLEECQGEKHVVVLHDFPDPDAISAAFAHKKISSQFDITVDIMFKGVVSHQQNIALIRLLNIDLAVFDSTIDFKQYDGAIFVDNQGTSAEVIVQALEAAAVPMLIVVDHHELQDRISAQFTDIRQVGSTATIYTEYIQEGLFDMDKSRQPHTMLATALMHGLISDTGAFIHATPADFKAAAFLTNFSDVDLLKEIMRQSRSRHVMDTIRKALGNRITKENYSIAGIGYLRAEDRDAIPQAADFLLTEANVHTAIVYGIVRGADKSEALIGSFRTSKITIDPDAFIKSAFGKDMSGHYYGGGKNTAGGFNIPLGFLSGEGSDGFWDLKWDVYDKQIKQKVFAKIGVQSTE